MRGSSAIIGNVIIVVVIISLQSLCVDGRLAPPNINLSVGTGLGLPTAVKDKYHSTNVIQQGFVDLERTCKYLVRHEIEAIDPNANSARKNDAYTLTDPDVSKENKKRFMLTFGVHGREYISSETAFYLAKYVCDKTATNHVSSTAFIQINDDKGSAALVPESPITAPITATTTEKSTTAEKSQETQTETNVMVETELDKNAFTSKMTTERLRNILKTTEITFIPIVNPDGRKKVETGDSCTNQRKNGRNVDINRNFQNWWNPSNAQPYEEDYQGASPMSEWETNIIKTLADKFQPHAYIDIHSGDLGLGFVYGHSATEVSRHDYANSKWVQLVDDEVFASKVWRGNLARMGSMPYESHGSSCDYMYESQQAKISGTWEIWRKPTFFSSSASQSSSSAKYEHVSVKLTPTTSTEKNILPANLKTKPDVTSNLIELNSNSLDQELQSLIDASMGTNGFNNEMGLSRNDMEFLVQSMKTEGKQTNEIQNLLQEMSKEQCFAYFNPIMPEHFDRTVRGFSYAILVGAEKLSDQEIVTASK